MTDIAPISQQSQGKIILEQPKIQQRYNSFFQLLLIVSNYALGNFYFGYCMVYLSSIQFSTIAIIYGITIDLDLATGLLVAALPIGAGIGALSSNFLLKNYSRRQSLLIVNLIALAAGCLLFIENFFVLLLIRIIQGLCVGAYSSLVPILIKQITPVEASGKLGVMAQFFIALGVFFAFLWKFLLQKITGDELGFSIWVYVFGFTLLTISLQTIVIVFIHKFETPKYLIQKQQYLSAKQLIALIYKPEFVQQVYKQKLNDSKKNPKNNQQQSVQVLAVQNKNIIKENKKVQNFQENNKTPTIAIFLALHLGLFQQFTGVNAVLVYGGATIGEVFTPLKNIFPILISFIQVLAPLILSTILTCVGRKPIMQMGTFFNIITTGIVGVGFILLNTQFNVAAGMILAGLLLFMINFSLTIGPLVWLYVPQIVQPQIVTIATAMNWLGATLIMFLFPIIKGKVLNNNPAILFFFFSGWSLLSFFINQKCIVETKDKTQKQIRDQFTKQVREKSTQQSNSVDQEVV